jgi:hypothetical protein
MVASTQIREHMPVVCSNNKQFGTVDKVEGDYIKLTADGSPDHKHHWIPLSWVTRVDQHVHVDRPGDQAMREWLSSPPAGVGAGMGSQSSSAMDQGASH